jgi:hypothetical protein
MGDRSAESRKRISGPLGWRKSPRSASRPGPGRSPGAQLALGTGRFLAAREADVPAIGGPDSCDWRTPRPAGLRPVVWVSLERENLSEEGSYTSSRSAWRRAERFCRCGPHGGSCNPLGATRWVRWASTTSGGTTRERRESESASPPIPSEAARPCAVRRLSPRGPESYPQPQSRPYLAHRRGLPAARCAGL